jgi:7-keto-8-aminopelargonate synthetase-like enzyme
MIRQAIAQQGWNVGQGEGPIIPIYVGQAARAMEIAAVLADRGLYVPGIRPPSVPEGESLLRISLSYAHTPAMVDRLLAALAELAA